MHDLLQKNVWSRDERQTYVFGSWEAKERAKAKGAISYLERKLAREHLSGSDRAIILSQIDDQQDYLDSLTPKQQQAAE